ncbi:MAG: hypothetical protein K6E49_05765 [Lachnospiraceae bacterium]|nr:hypothetical protein [Lachnospiraceae bacterium]
MALTAQQIDVRKFYEAIVNFDDSEEAQDLYYKVMDMPTGRKNNDDSDETVRDRVLKAYATLFCEDAGLKSGDKASADNVADTADRLYIGSAGYDPEHWYRMKYHFQVIDDDNYDRFAALVLSDMNSGPLHEAAVRDGDTLVVGEANPLSMTMEERSRQHVHKVTLPGGGI